MATIECTRRDDARPICPHCSTELRSVLYQQLEGKMGKRFLYFCGSCRHFFITGITIQYKVFSGV